MEMYISSETIGRVHEHRVTPKETRKYCVDAFKVKLNKNKTLSSHR